MSFPSYCRDRSPGLPLSLLQHHGMPHRGPGSGKVLRVAGDAGEGGQWGERCVPGPSVARGRRRGSLERLLGEKRVLP